MIPSSSVSLGKFSFRLCCSISSVSFESLSELRSIGKDAFGYCKGLTSIAIPSSVETMQRICFAECERLELVTFQRDSKVTRIIAGAFFYCFSLQSFVVPVPVEHIGESAFDECSELPKWMFQSPGHLRALFSLAAPDWRQSGGVRTKFPIRRRISSLDPSSRSVFVPIDVWL
jgi:hypothetical protein